MNNIKITVLVENTAGRLGVLGEHGLSFLIETGGEKVLFDTGQGFVLKHNLQRLGLSLADVKTTVLSHGHYDHTGGLSVALSLMSNPAIYAHPAVIEPKFGRNTDGSARFIGMSELNKDALLHSTWIRTTEPVELPGGLRLTGPIPRMASFEDTGGPFYQDADCTDPDPIEDDQSAFIDTSKGTIVTLGCAHAGIVNTLKYIQHLTNNRPIHAVIGGMHLHSASEERLNKTVEELRKLKIQFFFPCHCTGFAAAARLANEFPGQASACPVGTKLLIE
jgi:7,8-dihydropterin-6-yl-methyl-4-(beta-D-ribofuranosyl)aminobenzene 5'-phosphate synthase